VATRSLTFRAFGVPITQGSMNAYRRGDRIVLTHSRQRELEQWRADVAEAAYVAGSLGGWPLGTSLHVALSLRFMFRRPASHMNRAGQARPAYGAAMPGADLDKLTRAVLDALTGVLYDDDRRVIVIHARKCWTASEPGLMASAVLELSE
jgi:crossover junction endodeoxyribonuclease RusA